MVSLTAGTRELPPISSTASMSPRLSSEGGRREGGREGGRGGREGEEGGREGEEGGREGRERDRAKRELVI